MANTTVQIQGLAELRANFQKFPEVVTRWLNKAIQASIAEIHKNADDSGDSGFFEFKTPRSQRTGYLALSFGLGIKFGNMYGEIGPTANYAGTVYRGYGSRSPNPYMDRIVKGSEAKVNTYFADALDEITKEIAKQ